MSVKHFIACITLALLAAVTANAQNATVEVPHTATFESVVDAVLDASRRHNPQSMREDQELIGTVFQQCIDGKLRFGYTVGAGEIHRDRVLVRLRIPQDSQMVATWRTHGSKHWSQRYFSSADTELATTTRLPVYLVTGQGELRVFQPGDRRLGNMQARRLGLGNEPRAAKGKLVRKRIHRS